MLPRQGDDEPDPLFGTRAAGSPEPPPALPRDAEELLRLAARSMFDVFARTAQGMLVVDRSHRVVWISEGYKRFLQPLGFQAEEDFVGQRVEDVIPNTLMAQVIETGHPIMVDLLTNKAGTFLVSRLPLRDERQQVIGALGLVLMDHPETTMQPLMTKFTRLQKQLELAQRQLAERRRTKYTIASFVGSSPAALEVKRQARRAAATDATVLLLGATGTGKELLAQAIHSASARAARPFVGVNIAAVPETLLEAEFFGAAPGAYTGADRKGRDGKFKLAEGGTLFLDEIGDMSMSLQAKLLRVLQEREYEPLGSNRVETADVRIIAATSRDLDAMVAEGSFRPDLYYRLNVLPLRVPPLGERRDDIEALVETLLEDIARHSGQPPKSISAAALDALSRQPWPGNIRELRNVLEQASLMTDDLRLDLHHFGGGLRADLAVVEGTSRSAPAEADAAATAPAVPGTEAGEKSPIEPLRETIARVEADAIRRALAATGGNKLAAARLLGIARATLYERLAALHLD